MSPKYVTRVEDDFWTGSKIVTRQEATGVEMAVASVALGTNLIRWFVNSDRKNCVEAVLALINSRQWEKAIVATDDLIKSSSGEVRTLGNYFRAIGTRQLARFPMTAIE
jgi:chromosome condensin MukBEF complex kleisin-like MukF subunit